MIQIPVKRKRLGGGGGVLVPASVNKRERSGWLEATGWGSVRQALLLRITKTCQLRHVFLIYWRFLWKFFTQRSLCLLYDSVCMYVFRLWWTSAPGAAGDLGQAKALPEIPARLFSACPCVNVLRSVNFLCSKHGPHSLTWQWPDAWGSSHVEHAPANHRNLTVFLNNKDLKRGLLLHLHDITRHYSILHHWQCHFTDWAPKKKNAFKKPLKAFEAAHIAAAIKSVVRIDARALVKVLIKLQCFPLFSSIEN